MDRLEEGDQDPREYSAKILAAANSSGATLVGAVSFGKEAMGPLADGANVISSVSHRRATWRRVTFDTKRESASMASIHVGSMSVSLPRSVVESPKMRRRTRTWYPKRAV
jgi:hypothetical protein